MPQKKLVVLLQANSDPPQGILDAEKFARTAIATTAVDAARELHDAQALLMWDFASDLIRHNPVPPQLEWIHTASLGVDAVLTKDVVASNVVVTNSRNVFERPIAEYVLGLILAVAKDFRRTFKNQDEGHWEWRPTHRVEGQTVVVIGPGAIGREIFRLLTATGMRVLPVGRQTSDADPELGRVYSAADLDELLPQANSVVVALPLTSATRGFMTAARFAKMTPGTLFINIGRGALVDETALVDALERGVIGNAALDVFVQEPLPRDHRLWQLRNVIVSPHMSGDTFGYEERLAAQFMTNLQRWTAGQPLINVVDKHKLSASARERA
jgi:phosphoglycerate dehydrogenase-like enzyme